MSLLLLTSEPQKKRKTPCFGFLVVAFLVASSPVMAKNDPDELYRQGRFAEAEKIYADEDMNHPKDMRFRYNRGCAAYQNSDYQAAMAAFSSVLSRADDDETRFRAVYNMGNTAFKQGEPASAIHYFKQAVIYDPKNGNARHNLELALRKQKEQEQSRQKRGDSKDHSRSDSNEDRKGQPEQEQNETHEEIPDRSSREDASGKASPPQKQPEDKKNKGKHGEPDSEQKNGDQDDMAAENAMQRKEAEPPTDLSGELTLREAASAEEKKENEAPAPGPSMIDRKKAEALLNNIREDRMRFFRYLAPKEKTGDAFSGNDW